ncbi:MAG: cyclic lactone autoinducer peptide [Saccharofermentanales bacterium]
MERIGRFAREFGGIFSSIALIIGIASMNTVCIWWYHQPKVPEGMSRFKKHNIQ